MSNEVVKWLTSATFRRTEAEEEPEGKEWEVTIIGAKTSDALVTVDDQEYIKSKNGRLYAVEGIKESAPLWEGVKVYDNHLTQAEFEEKQGMRSPVKEWLGTIVSPWWDDASKQLKGIFKVVEDAFAKKLKNAWDQKVLDSIGLSIDTFIKEGLAVVYEGQTWPVVEGFEKIISCDTVGDPAAGGSFNRLIAANITEVQVTEQEIQAMINAAVTAAMESQKATVEATVKTILTEALATEDDADPTEEAKKAKKPDDEEMTDEEKAKMMKGQEALDRVALLESQILVKDAIAVAKLPEKLAAAAITSLSGRVVEKAQVDAVIKSLKEAQAANDPTGNETQPSGSSRNVQVGWTEQDKYAVEFARLLMGNSEFNRLRESETDKNGFVAERLNEAEWYKVWKKNDFKDIHSAYNVPALLAEWFGGNPLFDGRAMEAATTSSLATVVKNTVNIMIAADYSLQQRWYESIVKTEEVDTIDDMTLARLFGVNTLAVVPEGDPYTELVLVDEEETASFVKQGNYIGITMETLMRDKLNFVRTIPRRLSDTWYNTLSAHVAAVFTTNSATGPVLSDSGALFNATAVSTPGGHANLLTTALSTVATYAAARTAMRKQTNQPLGAGRKIQIEPKYLLVPEDLETTGLTIRNSQYIPGSANNDVNPFYQKFDVVTVPDWTDITDWALVGDPARWPAIWLIFPRGNRTPQLFTADSDVTGAMFTNDTLRFKARLLHYRFSATYSVAPVSDFRSLHKSNVAG